MVRGCPFQQIPQSVSLFYADMEKQAEGLLAAYTYLEMPAKYSDMVELYKAWLIYFQKLVRQRDNPSEAGAEIEAFRAKERRA